jgi:branched-chain amino acid transport system permease protein
MTTQAAQPKKRPPRRGMSGTARHYPTTTRFFTVLAIAAITIFISFLLNNVQNTSLAKGASISIAVLGLTWLTGWSGQISIGNSGFVLVGTYAAAIWDQHHPTGWVWVSLAIATAIGAIAGLIIGVPGTRLRGPYLAGLTIAFAVTLLPVIQNGMTSITGGNNGLSVTPLNPPRWFVDIFASTTSNYDVQARWLTFYVVVVAAISFFFMGNLMRSKTGRSMRLIRDNDVAAELVGIHLPRTRALAFVVSAAFGGLCGGLLAIVNNQANANYFPLTFSITLLTVMVLGGIGTLSGAVIAGIIYAFEGNLTNVINGWTHVSATSNLGNNMQGIISSVLLILTMLLAPRGIVGAFSSFKARVLARSKAPPPPQKKAPSVPSAAPAGS